MRRFNCDARIRAGSVILDFNQCRRGRYRHSDEDKYWYQRPDNFDENTVFKLCGDRIPGTSMGEDRVEHRAEYDDTNDDANPQSHVMDLLDTHAHFGDAGTHVEGRRK